MSSHFKSFLYTLEQLLFTITLLNYYLYPVLPYILSLFLLLTNCLIYFQKHTINIVHSIHHVLTHSISRGSLRSLFLHIFFHISTFVDPLPSVRDLFILRCFCWELIWEWWNFDLTFLHSDSAHFHSYP